MPMDRVESLVHRAEQFEGVDNSEAAKAYLMAAQEIVKSSQPDMRRANLLFQKGKALKGLKSPQHTKDGFATIGGLEDLKGEIRFKVIEPFLNPHLFRMYGKQVGGGILMYGPPGCGKTLIARATAQEADAEFVVVKSGDIESKYYGETQKNIQKLFSDAKGRQKPTILFFDEFDTLGRDRSLTRQEHSKDKVATLLSEIDGMDSKGSQVLLLAATNEPWVIDPALRREGRFGMSLYVPLPDHAARVAIMKHTMRERPIGYIDFAQLAKRTQGYSGADITAICEKATDRALRRALSRKAREDITMADFDDAMKAHQSIIPEWFRKAHKQLQESGLEESFPDLVHAARQMHDIEMLRKGNIDHFLDGV